jgi:SAM-dependent methyltransferase
VELPVQRLSAADSAVVETFVVPRYLTFFGELVLELLLPVDGARIVHLGCRTGYPDRQLFERVKGAMVVGLDPSPSALEIARGKAAVPGESGMDYLEASEIPTELAPAAFSHAVALHPVGSREQMTALFQQCTACSIRAARRWRRQLRGSFQELISFMSMLKFDDGDFGCWKNRCSSG